MAYIGIDIGHGSNTFPSNGKGVYRGGQGYAEHDFNSKLGVALKGLLEAQSHKVTFGAQQPFAADVSLTRRTDTFNSLGVDLVISIHANANSNEAVEGRCVFYWHNHPQSKSLAEQVAKAINNQGYSTHGNGLHASMKGSWTNLHMVRETEMTAVLIEHGFMTNTADFELIFGAKQERYIKDMAEADAKAVQAFLGQTYKSETVTVVKPSAPAKSIQVLAQEVIDGKHGSGDARKASLGSLYTAVQALVNEMVIGKAPAPRSTGIVGKYAEKGVFYPDSTIIVRNQPTTAASIIARYYKGEKVAYHTVHKGNGYVWLEYLRSNGKSGFIPCREFKGGKYGPLWGRIV